MKTRYRIAILLAMLLLSGCKVDLYSNLSEADANQMLALLMSNQIEARKNADKSGGLTLQVEQSDFVKAVEVLRQNGFPRRVYRSVDELFPSGQLVTSPGQEKAKIQFLREQSLERMLGNIEGVIEANVVIAEPENDSGVREKSVEPSASVLVKHSPGVNLKAFTAQLKNLVLNALPGVKRERISLVIQSADYRFAAPADAPDNASASPLMPEKKTTEGKTGTANSQAKGEVKIASMLSNEVKAAYAEMGIWPLLIFWLCSSAGVVWHGLRKSRKRRHV